LHPVEKGDEAHPIVGRRGDGVRAHHPVAQVGGRRGASCLLRRERDLQRPVARRNGARQGA
jgi:hypothetical protein